MLHLDFLVDDLQKEVEHAVACGAQPAETQYSDIWTVMLDPAGHPFVSCVLLKANSTAPVRLNASFFPAPARG
ncbi:MAG: hypothetical protein FWF49_03580 [Oscillospiraceae bacterium]|nr:hypothetical protein [Oscillospiraceae bacterium]